MSLHRRGRYVFRALGFVQAIIAVWAALGSQAPAESLPLLAPGKADPAVRLTIAEQPFRLTSDLGSISATRDGQTLFCVHLNEERVSVIHGETGAARGQMPVERYSFALAPDGRHFTARPASMPGEKEKPFALWSWPQREQVWSKADLKPSLTRFSPDGKVVAVLSRGRGEGRTPGHEVTALDAQTGKQLWQQPFPQTDTGSFPQGLAFIGNDLLVVSTTKTDPVVRAFRTKSGEPVELPEPENAEQSKLATAADAQVLLTYDNIGFTVYRLDDEGRLQRLFGDNPKSYFPLYGFRGGAISPDGKTVFMTTAEECRAYSVDAAGSWEPVKLRGEQAQFSGDGRTLIVGFDRALELLSTDSWKRRHPLDRRGHASRVTRLRFSPDGKLLASTDGETILLWNTETGAAIARMPLPIPDRWIKAITFHPRETLLYGSTGVETWWWDYGQAHPPKSGLPIDAAEPTHKRVMHMTKPPDNILASNVALDSAGAHMVRTTNGFASWLELGPDPRETAPRLRQLTLEGWGPREPIWQAVLSPDGRQAILTGYGVVRIYEFEPDRLVREIKAQGPVLSPDGHWCAARGSGTEKEITIRDLETGAVEATLALAEADDKAHSFISALAWSPDSTLVAAAAYEQFTVRSSLVLWDLKTAKRIALRPTHRGRIEEIALSADGRQLATGNTDGAIEIWDVERLLHE